MNKLGEKFCHNICKVNPEKSKKKCYKGKIEDCNYCILKAIPDSTTKFRQNQLCMDMCNRAPDTQVCKFYPFKMAIEKKKFNENFLKTASGM